MTTKIGGGNYGELGGNNIFDQLVKYAANGNNDGATLDLNASLSLGEPNELPEIPTTVNVTVRAGETPYQREYRALMQAAKDAGLPLDEQKQFAKDYTDGRFLWSKGDPTPKDSRLATKADLQLLVGKSIPYTLSGDQISGLEKRRNDFLARNESLISNQEVAANGSHAINDNAPVGEIKPNAPKAIRDFVLLPKNGGSATPDRTLFWHVKDKFGKANLEIDNFQNIFDRAKANGISVKITDVKPQGDNYLVRFEMNPQDAVKLKQLYIEEQTDVNQQIETVNNAIRVTVAQSFAEGFFTGAYGSLKNNADMLYTAARDPLGTAWKVGEALVSIPTLSTKIGVELGTAAVELAKLTPEQRQALVDELINAGHTELKGLTGAGLAKKTGEIVGALAMEAVLGKGAGLALKGLSALKGTAFLGKIEALAQAAKTTLANAKVPVGVSVEAVADTAGGVTPVVSIEKKPLGEVISNMMMKADETFSSSQKLEMLEDGSTAGREAITETAESGLMEKAQSGLKHLKYEIPKAVMARAKEQLVTLNVARTELMARLDDLIQTGNVLPDTKDRLKTAYNGLKDHLKQDDLVGALRDKFGKDVRKSGSGKIYDHAGEVQDGLAALDNAKDLLVRELRNKPKGSDDFIRLSQELDAIKEMQRRIQTFLELQ